MLGKKIRGGGTMTGNSAVQTGSKTTKIMYKCKIHTLCSSPGIVRGIKNNVGGKT